MLFFLLLKKKNIFESSLCRIREKEGISLEITLQLDH
jgi:hypothetical protein